MLNNDTCTPYNNSTITALLENITDGTHTISICAYDNAGNHNITSISIIIDTTDPVTTINTPNQSAHFTTSSISVTWSGTDATSGIEYYEIKIDAGNYQNVNLETLFTFTDVSDGSHTITIRTIDCAGNAMVVCVNVTVDTNIFSPNGSYHGLPLYLIIIIVILAIIIWLVRKKKKITAND